MTTTEMILDILTEVKPTKNLSTITDIIEGGYIDSFELMMLIARLSEKFGIEIEADDIVPENFNSVESITSMINRLKK